MGVQGGVFQDPMGFLVFFTVEIKPVSWNKCVPTSSSKHNKETMRQSKMAGSREAEAEDIGP